MIKLIVYIFLLSIPSTVLSKEIMLSCVGQELYMENFKETGRANKTYEVTFDSKKNTITSMTLGLAQGCFTVDYLKSTKCKCTMNEREISCESSALGVLNKTLSFEESFTINRYSGKMRNFKTMTFSEIDKSITTTSGDFHCEVFEKKRF